MSRTNLSMSISADGYVAGPQQSREHPLGIGGEKLHGWHVGPHKDHPVNRQVATEMLDGMKATIMGRNMFGPIRGEWDGDWRGWWGDDPPYHGPVFVLTHYPREPLLMEGGTTFHFVTDGIDSALAQARDAAGDRNVAIAGGAATINQYLRAGHIDELRIHIAPVLLGAGERLFDGVPPQQLEIVGGRTAALVTHITYRKAS